MNGHIPVLVQEVVESLKCGPGRIFVDCTVGAGGHAEAILKASEPDGRVVGLDWEGNAGHLENRLRPSAASLRVRLIT